MDSFQSLDQIQHTQVLAYRLTHQIYTWSKSLADTGITNWAEHMSNLLSSLYENNQDYTVDDLWDAVME